MNNISIISLSEKYLKQAENLVNKVFSEEDCDASKELRASISEKEFDKYRRKYESEVLSLEYFIAQEGEKLVGIVGLYTEEEDYEDTVWLGWYCVDPTQRGKSIGTKLLNFAIDRARDMNKKYLCLYTSTDESERKAQLVYEKYGFHITHTQNEDGYDLLYREKEL